MTRRPQPDTEDSGLALLWFFLFVMAIAYGFAEGCDWLDRRSCRVNGGSVQKVDGKEWRCVAVQPERAP